MFLMISLMLPCFLFAMVEKDGLPFEKILWIILRSKILLSQVRPYRTDNFYNYLDNSRKEATTHTKITYPSATIRKKASPPPQSTHRAAEHTLSRNAQRRYLQSK